MTELVAEAESAKKWPPMRMNPGDLASSSRPPTMPELRAAVSLSRLVQVFDRHIMRQGLCYRGGRPERFTIPEDERLPREQ